jgi:hypothetical protein
MLQVPGNFYFKMPDFYQVLCKVPGLTVSLTLLLGKS